MKEDPRYCGNATCIVDAEGRCWCGRQWPDEDAASPVPAGPPEATAPRSTDEDGNP